MIVTYIVIGVLCGVFKLAVMVFGQIYLMHHGRSVEASHPGWYIAEFVVFSAFWPAVMPVWLFFVGWVTIAAIAKQYSASRTQRILDSVK